jgi:RND family efflux transporter MFP subunit
MTVGLGNLQSTPEFAGEIRPKVESRLGFRVAGKLIQRHVETGQRVSAGQLLAAIDPQDYKLATDVAQAQLGSAITNRDLAAADFKRFKELRLQNFISDAELERREATLKAAQAQVEQAQAQLSTQNNQGSYTHLVADAPGVVTAVEVEPGQVVSAGLTVFRVALDGPRDAVFFIPEDKLVLMRMGSAVQVRVWPSEKLLAGRVREVSASADPVTRTYQIKAALLGNESTPLGATVTVLPQLPVQTPTQAKAGSMVIKLPISALRQDGKATAVWLLDRTNMTVNLQTVQVATADGNEAVISSGLLPGQQVVTAGVHVLTPGQKVTLYQEKSTAVLGRN